jgi:molecular chaperone DnaJ
VKKKIQVPRHEVCDLCNGSGAKTSADVKTCQTCGGRGQVMMASGFFRMAQPCPTCHGQGKVITDPCTKCHGQGLVRVTRKIEVNFPSGVDTDSQLRVRGEGEQAQGGKGDLYLYIRVKPHSVFTRSGNDLQMDLNMSFVKAALGAEVSVATLGGNVTMKIPEGTQSGKIFRLKGRGMPDLRSNAHPGDLYVRVMLTVPTKLSSEQRKLLEEYAQASGESVNKGGDTITEKLKKVFK